MNMHTFIRQKKAAYKTQRERERERGRAASSTLHTHTHTPICTHRQVSLMVSRYTTLVTPLGLCIGPAREVGLSIDT